MIAPTQKLKMFVYGSLRTGFFNYDKYLKGHVIKAEPAKVNGTLYHMPNKGYPALLKGTDEVYGEVITVDNYETVMEAIDEMEGYLGIANKNNEYNRVVLDVHLLDTNELEKCYVYMYNLEEDKDFLDNREYLPHGDWTKNRKHDKIV